MHIRKLQICLGARLVVFAGYSGFLHYLQLASHELATIGIKCDEKRNSNVSWFYGVAVRKRAKGVLVLGLLTVE